MRRPLLALTVFLAIVGCWATVQAQTSAGLEEILLADTVPGAGGQASLLSSASEDFRRTLFTSSSALWATDGTAQGTKRLPAGYTSTVHWLDAHRLYFMGFDPNGEDEGIWVTDFTTEGTSLLLPEDELSSTGIETRFVSSQRLRQAFFARPTRGPGTADIWMVGGADTPPTRLLTPSAGFEKISPSAVWDVGSTTLLLTLSTTDSDPGLSRRDVFRLDSASGGVEDALIVPPPTQNVVRLGQRLVYLSLDEATGKTGLWRTDGNPGPAEKLAEDIRGSIFNLGGNLFAGEVSAFGSSQKFARYWSIDLASGAQTEVASFATDRHFVRIVSDWMLVFLADPDTFRLQSVGAIRRTGYTELIPDPLGFTVGNAAVEGDRVFISVETESQGRELWISDGTPQGSRFVDVCPGPCSSDIWPPSPKNRRVDGKSLFVGYPSSAANAAPPPSVAIQLVLLDDLGDSSVEVVSNFRRNQGPELLPIALEQGLVYIRSDPDFGREPRAIPLVSSKCSPSPTTLCLGDERFQVDVTWTDFLRNTGSGRSVPLTEDTGSFWFFDPDNLELVVKVIDGTAINGNHWVFYGALSDVAYELRVTDTTTGRTATYTNPAGTFGSRGDIGALPGGGSKGESLEDATLGPGTPAASTASANCSTTQTTLCLADRFEVTVSWTDFQGGTGTGQTLPLTTDTGSFWFFDSENIELVLKVIDGTAVNGRFWVFYGALSNVAFEITVTDTVTGAVKTYSNPSGTFASNGDTQAF